MQSVIDFIIEVVLWIPRFIYSLFVDMVEFFVNMLPDMSGIGDAMATFNASGVGYFVYMMNLNTGLSLIFTAYVARWILRRIPGIG
jgi:hypothetical protein